MLDKIKLIMYILKGGDKQMAKLYATLIIYGSKKFTEVPQPIKEKVRQILLEAECEHLIEE